MAFDFKKEFKEFYMPKNKPEIVNVPKANQMKKAEHINKQSVFYMLLHTH